MTNPELQTVMIAGQNYKQAPASELAQHVCPGCVADSDMALCHGLSNHGCFDHEQRGLIWLKVVE